MKCVILIFISFLSHSVVAEASGSGLSNDSEYRQMLDRLNQRYQDFFSHQQDQKRFEAQRLTGTQAVKKNREAYNRQAEQARIQYIKNRKAAPDMTPLQLKWEAEQKRAAREYDKSRQQYVIKKNRINKVEKTARQIPPEVESGLIPTY